MKKIIGILAVLLGIVIVVALVGYILQRQGCISFEYSVSINGETYTDGDTVKLKYGENVLVFKQAFHDTGDISVEIRRNKDKDFDFKAGDKILGYTGLDDLTPAFDIKEKKGETILTIPDGATMQTVLQKLYPDEVVSGVPASVNIFEESYFFLQVNFGRKTMIFDLLIGARPTEIVLDPPNIIF